MSRPNTDILQEARAALERFDSRQALRLLETAKEDPEGAEYLGCLMEAQAQAKDFEGAEATVARATSRFPQDVSVRMSAGLSAMHARNYPLAQERFTAVTLLKADYAPAYNNLGMVHEYLHDEEQARAAYAQAIRHNPALAPAYQNLGRMAEMGGRLDEARTLYEQGRASGNGAEQFDKLLAGLGSNFSGSNEGAQSATATETLLAQEIAKAAERHLPEGRKVAMVDLICGGGIVGGLLWRHTGMMIGVDPRIGMLQQAQAAGVYYDLKDQTPSAFLRTCKRGETDLITANCAFIDQGDLLPFFLNAYAVLARGGLLVMAFPTQEDSLGYSIENNTYTHDPRYVAERADFEGMKLLERIDYSAESHPSVDHTYSLMVFAKPA